MAPSPSPYRDDEMAARIRYDELLAEKRSAVMSVEPLAQIEGRRVGRIAAGAVGVFGFGGIVALLIVEFVSDERMAGLASAALFLVWVLSFVAYLVAGGIAEVRFGRSGLPPRSEDVRADIERLSEIEPDLVLRDKVDRREVWSVALPMIAVSLLGPLTLHLILYSVALILGIVDGRFVDFDKWMALSLAIVGHAHLVAAGLCYRYAKKVSQVSPGEVIEMSKRSDSRTFWWTVLASAIPGAILLLIPPVVALVTGRGISWVMFRYMQRKILEERSALKIS